MVAVLRDRGGQERPTEPRFLDQAALARPDLASMEDPGDTVKKTAGTGVPKATGTDSLRSSRPVVVCGNPCVETVPKPGLLRANRPVDIKRGKGNLRT